MTVIGFNICYSVSNFIKYRFFTGDMATNDFQNGGRPARPLSWILKICSFCHVAFDGMPFCCLVQNFAQIAQSVDELWPKKRFSRWRPLGSISGVVYQISSKSDDFSLRYGDLTIFKTAAIRHLGFVMTSQYRIAGHIFVVQILSWNFMLIGFLVSEILATISYVGHLAVHNGPWQCWGCACAVSRDP